MLSFRGRVYLDKLIKMRVMFYDLLDYGVKVNIMVGISNIEICHLTVSHILFVNPC